VLAEAPGVNARLPAMDFWDEPSGMTANIDSVRRCEACHTDVGAGDRFCKQCGAKIADSPSLGKSDTPLPGVSAQNYGFNDPDRAFKTGIRVVIFCIGIVVTVWYFAATPRIEIPDLSVQKDLKVEKTDEIFGFQIFKVLRLTNVGKDDIEIIDISINDRDECTENVPPPSLRVASNDRCLVDVKSVPHFFRHIEWLRGGASVGEPFLYENADGDYSAICLPNFRSDLNSPTPIRVSLKIDKIVLKVGDVRQWTNRCGATVRATIKTNHGPASYRWE
jgi:hypothetical protein